MTEDQRRLRGVLEGVTPELATVHNLFPASQLGKKSSKKTGGGGAGQGGSRGAGTKASAKAGTNAGTDAGAVVSLDGTRLAPHDLRDLQQQQRQQQQQQQQQQQKRLDPEQEQARRDWHGEWGTHSEQDPLGQQDPVGRQDPVGPSEGDSADDELPSGKRAGGRSTRGRSGDGTRGRFGDGRSSSSALSAGPASDWSASDGPPSDEPSGDRQAGGRQSRGRFGDRQSGGQKSRGGFGDRRPTNRQPGSGQSSSGQSSSGRPDDEQFADGPMPGNEPAGRQRPRPPADPEAEAREILLKQLSAGSRTRAELAKTLAQKEIPSEVAQAVLDRFEEVDLVNDAAFSRNYVEHRRAGRGLAKRALEYELRQKGVAAETVREAVDVVSPDDELATARELVRKKAPSMMRDDPERRLRRLAGMLARKGYGSGVAYQAIREELADLDTSGLYEPD